MPAVAAAPLRCGAVNTQSRFATDTAVVAVAAGRYAARVDAGWWIVAGPNGGYIAAIVANACRAAVDGIAAGRPLRSLTVHYLRPPQEGEVDVEVAVERSGRSVTTARATMSQGGRTLVLALASYGEPRDCVGFDDRGARSLVAPERFALPERPEGSIIPLTDRWDMIPVVGAPPVPPPEGGVAPAPSSAVGGRLRLADPHPVDEAVLAAMCDAWWPPIFSRLPGMTLAVPTIDLTVHIERLPDDRDDWVYGEFASPRAADGFLLEDAVLWDRRGRVLARARQLALVA